MMSECTVCHRPLTNAESIRLSMGPVCRARAQRQRRLIDDIEDHNELILDNDPLERIVMRRTSIGVAVNVPHRWKLHSPDGFEWGYAGSGPADLALNILLQHTSKENAEQLHQRFKNEFIVSMPAEGGEIAGDVIRQWLSEKSGPRSMHI